MKLRQKPLLLLSAFCLPLFCSAVTPDSPSGPYQSIVDRNVFGLKPPPPPPDPNELNKPPPSNIILTGITTILGKKQALLKTPPAGPAKPGEPPRAEHFYILTEGEREGDIAVVSINEKEGWVKVDNAGAQQELTFEKNGQKVVAGAGVPGLPAPAGFVPPAPSPINPAASRPSFPIPGRPVRAGGRFSGLNGLGNNPGTPGVGSAGLGNPSLSVNGTTLPAFGSATPANTAYNQAQASGPPINAEDAALMTELERERTKGLVQQGLMAPPPLTMLTPKGAPGTPEAAGIGNVDNGAAAAPATPTPTQPRLPLPGRPPGFQYPQ